MKKIKLYLSAIFALAVLSACETADLEPQGTSYVALEAYESPQEVPPGGTLNREVKVYAANVTNEDRVLNIVTSSVTLDAAAYTVPATVTIPAGATEGSFVISVSDVNLDAAKDKGVTVNLAATPEIATGDSFRLNVSRACPTGEQKLRVSITLDRYPEEVFWRIRTSAGVTVASNGTTTGGGGLPAPWGGYAGLPRNSVQSAAACLPPGDYTFQIYDAYQDGAGAVLVTLPNNITVYSSGGAYGAGSGPIPFTVN